MSADEPMAPEDIAREYDLPVEAVKEAIAYCQANLPEIKEDFEREERKMEATGMNDSNYKFGGKYRMLSPQERARLGL
jgi:predicted phage tail protein